MSKTASFRDFLKTGKLGPLETGKTLLAVADALGPPNWFQIHPDTKLVPSYWGYGKVEISFDLDPPYEIQWFQIENAGELSGKHEAIAKDFKLALEGFSATTKPSEFLQAGLWLEAIVHIGALADDLYLNISAGRVAMHFRVDSSFVEDGDAARYANNTPVTDLVKDLDSKTTIDSIYAMPSPDEAIRSASVTTIHQISGKDYLAAL
ncbi:hypothetical protein HNQ96_005387 [Aminobacter lissarensis]|uniref:Uncharacterized protein n=1 Tax=Aminobacter carboxidus TaxID=376165 RepID=A0A8E1WLQ7_9HYPH|nr:hypothetical protein [Aminobacter lissarensis]MBB6469497.1 hypothetical protein [Aminobacter lissarensis]